MHYSSKLHWQIYPSTFKFGDVAELADAYASGAYGEIRESSTLSIPTYNTLN